MIALVVGVIVTRPTSSSTIVTPAVLGEEATPSASFSPEDLLDPQEELAKPEVVKATIKNVDGLLEVSFTEASSGGQINVRGKTRTLAFPVVAGKNEGQVKIQVVDGGMLMTAENNSVKVTSPITYNKVSWQLSLGEGDNEKDIRVLPGQAKSIATIAGIDVTGNLELTQAPAGKGDTLVYQLAGKKSGNLFWVFPVSADIHLQVGAQTGLILQSDEPTWMKILSPIIR